MKIMTYGNKNHEKILLLHPMFTNAEFFDCVKERLSHDFDVIVPTYSGHYENSNYISMEDEEKYIDQFLKENNIDKLKAIIGFSLGGNIAFHYFCHHQDQIDQVIIDSAPIFHFPKMIQRYFYHKYKKCLINIKKHPENTIKGLNKCFHGMGEVQQYVAPMVTNESLKNLIKSCYMNETPSLDIESQKKITFVYGTKDKAKLCLPRIKKYKKSQFIKIESLDHCGYFMKYPDEYFKKFIK